MPPAWYWLLLAAVILLIPTAYAGLIGAPYAPTRMRAVKRAFELLDIGVQDTVVDLGVGDGKVLLAAAGRGAKAYGYELSPIMFLIAFLRSLKYPNVSIRFGSRSHATMRP